MKSLKILVIEDDIFFSGILARYIQQTDAGVIVEARTGTLEDLFVCQPDVLLLDLDIPGLKNLNKISLARKILPQALIFVMVLLMMIHTGLWLWHMVRMIFLARMTSKTSCFQP